MTLLEFRLKEAVQPLTDTWQELPIVPRRSTLLGISYRPKQAAAFNLDGPSTLQTLLSYPFQIIRIGAYWSDLEPEFGKFQTDQLDWQINTVEQAGKQIILCLGPLKNFGYPEFFVPNHILIKPFPEHTLIRPTEYSYLLEAAITFIYKLVERYKHVESIVMWQLEHEALDPLGVEHSWRLDRAFVEKEAEALRKADPSRPFMMNGFLPTSLLVRLSQWWNTHDQGDSLAIAERLADMIGIDYYPRHALLTLGNRTIYLDGSQNPWQQRKRKKLLDTADKNGQKILVAEGQAEPWETITTPPNPKNQGMYSCLPEHLITNYNDCMESSRQRLPLYAYLFWGAEYWVLRKQNMDSSYLNAFARILELANN